MHARHARHAWLLVLLLPAFAGCLDGGDAPRVPDTTPDPAEELRAAKFARDEPFSVVATPGPYEVLPVDDVRFPSFDGTEIAAGVWRPGTDEPSPVILMISPYFSTGLFTVDRRFVENFVPHGYTFAKVAVRGTSYSDGCMESMGESEQKDIDAAVTFFYWAQYGTANEITEVEPDDVANVADNVCAAPMVGLAASQYAIATGEMGPFADYWNERDLRPGVLANYNASVFLVHGLRDWNVNADMAYPFVNALEGKGLEVKHLLGQWQHSWPDATAREEHVRYDFAEILLRYFDTHLKETPRYHGPLAEVEDNLGLWRKEASWPPRDAEWTPYYLASEGIGTEPGSGGTARLANPAGAFDGADCRGTPASAADTPVTAVWMTTGPLAEELRYAGLAQLHLTVAPADPRGGELSADLYHVSKGQVVSRVNHAVMDLKFHAGGHEPQTLSPGQPVVARMEFYPADVAIPAGDELALRIAPDTGLDPCTNANNPAGEDTIQGTYLPGQSPAPPEVMWGGESSVLRLPVIHRDVGDGKYDGQPD